MPSKVRRNIALGLAAAFTTACGVSFANAPEGANLRETIAFSLGQGATTTLGGCLGFMLLGYAGVRFLDAQGVKKGESFSPTAFSLLLALGGAAAGAHAGYDFSENIWEAHHNLSESGAADDLTAGPDGP